MSHIELERVIADVRHVVDSAGGYAAVGRSMDALEDMARKALATEPTVREVIDILSNSRHSFRSKQIERARVILEGLLP